MNKKTIYIIVAVLVVVIVVAGAGILLLNGGGGGEPTPTATPTPTASIADATALQFSVEITHTDSGEIEVYNFAAKDLDTETEKIRVDMDLGEAGKFSYIVDAEAQKSWMTMDEGATWTESDYTTDSETYTPLLCDYVDKLVAEGSGTEDYTYTGDNTTIKIYDISVDPTLEDSLFTAS